MTVRWIVSAGMALLLCGVGALASAQDGGDVAASRWLEGRIQAFVLPRVVDGPVRISVPPLAGLLSTAIDPEIVDVELESEAAEPLHGEVPITVTLRRAGEVLERTVVTVAIEEASLGLVAARPIARGDTVSERDVELVPVEGNANRRHAVTAPEVVVGKQAKRNVAAGATLRANWFEEVPVVRRGEPVRIRFEQHGLRIDASGIARQDAREGEAVRVENSTSRREVIGRADADGVVHVAF